MYFLGVFGLVFLCSFSGMLHATSETSSFARKGSIGLAVGAGVAGAASIAAIKVIREKLRNAVDPKKKQQLSAQLKRLEKARTSALIVAVMGAIGIIVTQKSGAADQPKVTSVADQPTAPLVVQAPPVLAAPPGTSDDDYKAYRDSERQVIDLGEFFIPSDTDRLPMYTFGEQMGINNYFDLLKQDHLPRRPDTPRPNKPSSLSDRDADVLRRFFISIKVRGFPVESIQRISKVARCGQRFFLVVITDESCQPHQSRKIFVFSLDRGLIVAFPQQEISLLKPIDPTTPRMSIAYHLSRDFLVGKFPCLFGGSQSREASSGAVLGAAPAHPLVS